MVSSVAVIALSFTVPVVCKVIDNKPSCNLILTKVNSTTWIDAERGYQITLVNNILTIKEIK